MADEAGAFRERSEKDRFELVLADGTAFATYRDVGGKRAILHVETPAHMRGQGVAERLMDGVVGWAREAGVKLTPRCSYAVRYQEAKPETADVWG